MAMVSVEEAAVRGGISCCQISMQELSDAVRQLQSRYQQAGANGWRDNKYAELGSIVNECCTALSRSLNELRECERKLGEILRVVSNYDETHVRIHI